MPESLKYATVEAARAVAGTAGSSIVAGSSVSLPVATLAQGVLQAMIMSKLKAAAITLLVTVAVTTGAVISAAQGVVPRTKSYPDANADSSGPATRSESSASSGAAGAGGQAPAGAGMAGTTATSFEGGGGNFAEVAFEDRLVIAQLGAELAATESNPRNDAVLKALDEPLTLSFDKPTRLADVLKYIKTTLAKSGRPPLPIYVDPKGLEDAEVKPEATVVIDLEGAPLKTSLRLLLKQLGLAYCVRDGVIIISSVEGVRQELAEAARELFGAATRRSCRRCARWVFSNSAGPGRAAISNEPRGAHSFDHRQPLDRPHSKNRRTGTAKPGRTSGIVSSSSGPRRRGG